MKRRVSTGIIDPKKRVCELLKEISVQLSDGYWENTCYFYEYWNWLSFTLENGYLYIDIQDEPCYEDADLDFCDYTDSKILIYVAEAVDYCTLAKPEYFTSWEDISGLVIQMLKKIAEAIEQTTVKICLEGPEKADKKFDDCLTLLKNGVLAPTITPDVSYFSDAGLFSSKPRDPDRIDKFLNILSNYWKRVPDWRFGQLLSNLNIKKDWYYIEDSEFESVIKNFFEHIKG